LTRLYTALKDVPPDDMQPDWSEPHAVRFADAMNDDFNTPLAIAVLFELANEINRTKSPRLAAQLKALAGTIGILQRPPKEFLQGAGSGVPSDEAMIAGQIEARTAAKKARNFAEADRIRTELLSKGIVLEDKPGGITEWRRS